MNGEINKRTGRYLHVYDQNERIHTIMYSFLSVKRNFFLPISSSFVTGNRFHVHVCVWDGNKWCNWRGPLSSRVQTLIVNEIYDTYTCIIIASCCCYCFHSARIYERARIFYLYINIFFLVEFFFLFIYNALIYVLKSFSFFLCCLYRIGVLSFVFNYVRYYILLCGC